MLHRSGGRLHMPKKLPTEEAVRRAIRITPLLAQDTWHTLRSRAALHTANDVIWAGNFNGPLRFGDTYNVVQNGLALTVALDVARIFDVSNPDRYPVEQQDKASIPVLANLLMRKDVQDAFAEAAPGLASRAYRRYGSRRGRLPGSNLSRLSRVQYPSQLNQPSGSRFPAPRVSDGQACSSPIRRSTN